MPLAGKNRLKPIPVEEFSEHVQRMHADRDKFFELEYNVRAPLSICHPSFWSFLCLFFNIIIGYREISSVRP